jgi:hypothetical protein
MGIFDFAKEIGDKIFHREENKPVAPTEPAAQEIANQLLARIQQNANIADLVVNYNGDTDTVEIKGTAANQAEREKAILAVGNVQYVAHVVDHIAVSAPEPESRMYTVKSGDTLSKIAKEMYGDANQYNKIFEANKPLLSDPNKIYPGQVLRIPN